MKKFISGVLVLTLIFSTFSPGQQTSAAEVAKAPVKVTTNSSAENLNSSSEGGQMSSDGRYVLFHTSATNTVAADTNGDISDVFVKDTQTGDLIPVSVTPGGVTGNGSSGSASISGNGRYVTFNSAASDLISGDTNGRQDVFIRDIVAGTTRALSDPTQTNHLQAIRLRGGMSFDGRYVVLESRQAGVMVRDLTTNIDKTFSGLFVQTPAVLSPDGQWLLFRSSCGFDCFNDSPLELMNVATGVREVVSIMPNGDISLHSLSASMSADGRYIAFLAPTVYEDIFVRDRVTGVTTLESVATDGTHTQYANESPCLSADGRVLTWTGNAQDAGSPASNNVSLRRNLDTHTTIDVTGIPWGSNVGSVNTACSSDGNRITYSVSDYSPETGDFTNIFIVDIVDDTTAPTTSGLTWSANPLLQGQNTTLSVTASDEVAVQKVEYSLEGGPRQAMTFNTSTGTWQVTLGASLAVSTYNVEVIATDKAGNESVPAQDVLAVYDSANGYVTGHAKLLPTSTDTLPIARDTGGNPAKLVVGFTNIKAGTTAAPTTGSFDMQYVVKNNKDEFNISSNAVTWLVVPDLTHASILGNATLTTYVDGVMNVHQNVTVRFDLTLGSPDHILIKIYDTGVNPSTSAPTWQIEQDAQQSQLMIKQ